MEPLAGECRAIFRELAEMAVCERYHLVARNGPCIRSLILAGWPTEQVHDGVV